MITEKKQVSETRLPAETAYSTDRSEATATSYYCVRPYTFSVDLINDYRFQTESTVEARNLC
jgi:hypothetical protein